MQRTIDTWSEFRDRWAGPHNFLIAGACVPFAFEMPTIAQVVDELRRDELVSIGSGAKGDRLDKADHAAAFRALPIDRAIDSPFSLAHYKLSRFDAPGKFLHGFKQRVLDPWQAALARHGFTWTRCYPIIFITGPGCATNYHMDYSHVLAWQIHGTKQFCGLREPDRWAPRESRVTYDPSKFAQPTNLDCRDAICYDMNPGAVLWNILLTPHWVEAGSTAAMSVNISHGGLRCHGRLSPNEFELEAHRLAQGMTTVNPVQATY